MTTPTTENPTFEFNPDDPPLDFPAYETSGHKTYLDYHDANEHGNSGHQSGKLAKTGNTAPKDALDVIATKPWLESTWAKVLVWVLIVAATYRIYLRVMEMI